MVKKKKKKKVILLTSKKKLKVSKKIFQGSKQLLKKRKAQIVEAKKNLAQMMEEDAGKGLEDINTPVNVNVFEIAKDIRDFKQLEDFIDIYIPALTAADVAVLAAQHAEDKWNIIKILKDPDFHGSIFMLLDAIDKTDGGAVKVFNDYNNKKTNPVTEFIKDTSYKMPRTITTFQNQLTAFKDHFGLTRKKKNHYMNTEKQKQKKKQKKKELMH